MSDTDPDLDRLQDVLNAIPAERDGMTIAELDGYVAALIVCPEMILFMRYGMLVCCVAMMLPIAG